MCGIVAMLSQERPLAPDEIERATAALVHRGPDGRGTSLLHGGRVALAHTRLALVDVDGGAQPLANEDGSVVAVVSGELYDDDAVRADLERRGHRFRTRSDSELCVHLYEEHGDAFVDFLRGEFAIALWDQRRGRLVCARDRFGVRPLCYARRGGVLAVASEAKALVAWGVPARWDAEALFVATSAQYVPEASTLFLGIAQLPPGHLLVADSRAVRTRRYWDIDFAQTASTSPRPTPTELLGALEDAVHVRLRGESSVACQLSGGIDSSVVAALAARRVEGLPCFSLSFVDAGPEYDEIAIATRTAEAIGATLLPVRVSQAMLLDALPEAVAAGEGFAINLHLPAKYLLSRAIRAAGHRVVLTGEGADEVLGGYAHFRQDMIDEHGGGDASLTSANRASAGIMLPDGERLSADGAAAVLGFLPTWLAAKASLGFRVTSLLAEDFRAQFAARDPYREIAEAFAPEALRDRARIDRSAYTWCKLVLATYILRTLGDGMEMAHAVEGRLPFLDGPFFDVARRLSPSQKINDAWVEKAALREAARGLVPEEILVRRKHPLLAPPLTVFGPGAFERVRDELSSSALPDFFDRARVAQALTELSSAPADRKQAWDPALMLLLTATHLGTHYGMASP